MLLFFFHPSSLHPSTSISRWQCPCVASLPAKRTMLLLAKFKPLTLSQVSYLCQAIQAVAGWSDHREICYCLHFTHCGCLLLYYFARAFINICELEICFLHISNPPETIRVGSRPGSAIINVNPGAIGTKCLAQGHIDRYFTLSAQRFGPATFWLLVQRSNR